MNYENISTQTLYTILRRYKENTMKSRYQRDDIKIIEEIIKKRQKRAETTEK